jgi:hypothetical protein
MQPNINDILLTQLDLPKFQPDDWDLFWQIWQRDSGNFLRKQKDSQGNGQLSPGWDGFSWEFNIEKYGTQQMWDVTCKDYSEYFPKFRAAIDALPFTTTRILFQSNRNLINPHKDGSPSTDHLEYPAGVRIIIHDENTQPNFYIVKNKTEKIYVDLKNDTNAFVYNNPKVLHAADYHGKMKIIAHLVIRDIDEIAYKELLLRSVNKYPNDTVWA